MASGDSVTITAHIALCPKCAAVLIGLMDKLRAINRTTEGALELQKFLDDGRLCGHKEDELETGDPLFGTGVGIPNGIVAVDFGSGRDFTARQVVCDECGHVMELRSQEDDGLTTEN